MSESKSAPEPYRQPEFTAEVNINSNGDFRWVPTGDACELLEGLTRAIKTVQSMPREREFVWGKRFDLAATKERCPLLKSDPSVSAMVDKFAAAYQGPGAT